MNGNKKGGRDNDRIAADRKRDGEGADRQTGRVLGWNTVLCNVLISY